MAYAAGEDRSSFQAVAGWAGDTFGFAKATEGTAWKDPTFPANWANLKREGLVRGAYHFFHPADDPVQQAEFFAVTVKNQGLVTGKDILIADVEITLGADGFEDLGTGHAGMRMHEYLKAVPRGATAGLVGPAALRFLNEVSALAPGYRVLLYTDLSMAQQNLGACSAYLLFLAYYNAAPPASVAPWPSWAFWQDGAAGPGGGDKDYFNGTPAALASWAAGNWTEALVNNLPTLALGAKDGPPSTTWYVRRLQNEVAGYGRWNGIGLATCLADSGTYDAATKAAVEAVQQHAGITQDGITGPQTWGVLIG